eukprot:scaffold86463_cov78-Phaeocystis_antarctica.AAC.2
MALYRPLPQHYTQIIRRGSASGAEIRLAQSGQQLILARGNATPIVRKAWPSCEKDARYGSFESDSTPTISMIAPRSISISTSTSVWATTPERPNSMSCTGWLQPQRVLCRSLIDAAFNREPSERSNCA